MSSDSRAVSMAGFLRCFPAMGFEILFGRLLAVCVHPQAAWRRLPVRGRLVLTAAYFTASYVAVLGVLLTF
jgi:hypothetical protein